MKAGILGPYSFFLEGENKKIQWMAKTLPVTPWLLYKIAIE